MSTSRICGLGLGFVFLVWAGPVAAVDETAPAAVRIPAALEPGVLAASQQSGGRIASHQPDGLIASPEPGWPQWRGPRRDGISAETGLQPAWPEEGPKLLWKREGLGQGWSSPIVVGQSIYVTGDVDQQLWLFALDLQGRLRWKTAHGKAWEKSFPGSRATCCYSAGRLYLLNAHGQLGSFDAATGLKLWEVDILQRFEGDNITWGISECVLVDGARVIVTPGGRQALVAALDKQTGETVWATPPLAEGRATYSGPILFWYAGRRVLANCSSDFGFGVDADSGRLLWKIPLKNQYGVNVSTPIYGAGRVFYVTAYFSGGCFQLHAEGDGIRAEPAWTTHLDTVTGGGVLLDNRLYAGGYRKPNKHWFCVDWTSGAVQHELKELTTAAALYAEGRLYCLAEDGRAALLEPTPTELKIRGEFRLVPKARDAWAHPVLLNGRLYLRYHDTLWCYAVVNR